MGSDLYMASRDHANSHFYSLMGEIKSLEKKWWGGKVDLSKVPPSARGIVRLWLKRCSKELEKLYDKHDMKY